MLFLPILSKLTHKTKITFQNNSVLVHGQNLHLKLSVNMEYNDKD